MCSKHPDRRLAPDLDGRPAHCPKTRPEASGQRRHEAGNFFSKTQLLAYEKFFEWQVGAASYAEALDRFRPWKVDVASISCPVLCMMGTGEAATFKKQTHACFAALRIPKALRVFTEEEGADAHSQANNQRLAHQIIFDFFDETFAQGKANNELWLADGV